MMVYLYFTRLTSRSTLGALASAVNSDARNTDGPNAGNDARTGSEPTTDAAAGFVLEAIDQRLQSAGGAALRRALDHRRRCGRGGAGRSASANGPGSLSTRNAPGCGSTRNAASSAARRPCATPADRAPADSTRACPLSTHAVSLLEVHQLDDEGRRLLAGAPFSSGSSTALASATPGRIGRPADLGAPHRRARRAASPSESCAGCCGPRNAPRPAAVRPPTRARGSALLRRWR